MEQYYKFKYLQNSKEYAKIAHVSKVYNGVIAQLVRVLR